MIGVSVEWPDLREMIPTDADDAPVKYEDMYH